MDRVIKLGASAIIERDGKVLLGRRSKDDPSLPGLWCTPGGGVELGESINEAIIREVREEVGLTVDRVHDTFISIQERISGSHTVLVFKKVSALGRASSRGRIRQGRMVFTGRNSFHASRDNFRNFVRTHKVF